MLGVVNSNYAGVYGISLNPSSMHGSKLYMDYNFISFSTFLGNDYVFVGRKEFVNFIYKGIIPEYYTEENELRNYSIYRDRSYYQGYQNIKLIGPGAMIVYKEHAFGLNTSFRSNSFFYNLPNDMGQFLYEAIDYEKQHGQLWSHDKPIRAGSLSWFELSLSYAYNFKRYKWDYWTIGVSLKPLLGVGGFYTNVQNVDYFVQHDDTAYIDNLTFDYSYSFPINYDDNSYEGPLISGFGFGVDLGITYMFTTKGHSVKHFDRLCSQRYEDYNIKVGVSLLDFGYIKFNKKAELRRFDNTSTNWYRENDTLPATTMNEINYKLDSYFSEYPGQSIADNKITLFTPPAISLQVDYHYKKYWYLNATIIYGFRLGNNVIKRPSIIAFTPRYEKNQWEVALHVSFVDWEGLIPHIGLYGRFGNFFIGSDNINSFIGLSDFRGIDVYIGLRLNLTRNFKMNFYKGNCGGKNMNNIEMFDFRNF